MPRGAPSDSKLDARVDELYAGPPEEFVANRDRLAADLKVSGDAESAKAVKALRRPTVAAWALNQLARQHPDDVQALLDAGRGLRDAQAKAMGGGGPEALREATARRRAATRTLVDRATRLLSEAGRGPDAQRDAIAGTLDAAALDEEVGQRLTEGRLEREEAPPSGLGGLEQLADVIPLPTRPRPGKAKGADTGETAGRRPAATKVDPRAERLAKEARHARSEADRLSRRAKKLEDEARRLEREARDAQAKATRARAEARTVGREAREAARQATSAESAALRATRR